MLLLVAIGFYTAKQTSLLVFTSTHPDRRALHWDAHFHHELATPGVWFFYRGTPWLVAKLLTSPRALRPSPIVAARGQAFQHRRQLRNHLDRIVGDALRAASSLGLCACRVPSAHSRLSDKCGVMSDE